MFTVCYIFCHVEYIQCFPLTEMRIPVTTLRAVCFTVTLKIFEKHPEFAFLEKHSNQEQQLFIH